MTGAHWLLIAAATGAAVLWLWLARSRPRIRPAEDDHPQRRDLLDLVPRRMRGWPLLRRWYWQADELAEARRAAREWADEVGDPTHEQIDQALDIATEVDRAKADHLNAAMRRAEHPWTHLTDEEAADCPVCSPSSLPRRIEGGDE